MKKFLCIIVVVMILFLTSSGVSFAENPNPPVIGPYYPVQKIVPNVTHFSNGDSVITFGGVVNDKKSAIDVLKSFGASSNPITIQGYTYNFDAFKSIPFGDGYCYAQFHTQLDFDLPAGFTTRVTVEKGSSWVEWTGTSPQYNADIINISEDFTWNAIGSVSISTQGGGWSVVGHSVTWSLNPPAYNTWYYNHIFGGLSGSGALTSISESTTGDLRFNSVNTSVTPTAYQSMIV